MSGTAPSPEGLAQRHPEWRPWLRLLAETLRAVSEPAWESFVASPPADRAEEAPLLTGALIAIDRRLVNRWAQRLLGHAAEVAVAARPLHAALRSRRLDPLGLLEAAVGDDPARLGALAGLLGSEPALLKALAPLVAMPLLHASQRKLGGAVPMDWRKGYCPVCGAWPIVAEDRGLERARRLRCNRCGADWAGDWLRCLYCDERDHAQLGGLVSGTGHETRRVETCGTCRGYVKIRTRLQATPPAELALDDLASIDLDVAAIDHGYVRPEGLGYPLGVRTVEARRGLGGLLGWRP